LFFQPPAGTGDIKKEDVVVSTASKTEMQERLRKETAERQANMAKQKSDRLAAKTKKTDELEQHAKRVAALYKSMREFEAHAEEKAGFELKKAAEKRAALEQALVEARVLCKAAGENFKTFQEKFAPNYKRTRLYQALAIADGRKTVEDVREEEREKKRKQRAGKVSGTTGNVPDDATPEGAKAPRKPKTEAPAAKQTTLDFPGHAGGSQPVLMASAERPIEEVQAKFAALAGEEAPPAGGSEEIDTGKAADDVAPAAEAPPADGEPTDQQLSDKPDTGAPAAAAKPSRLNVADTALHDFTARVLDLVRRIAKHDAKRFAGTAVKADELLKLGRFFTELGQLKPTVH
jgi:hypothetical protein